MAVIHSAYMQLPTDVHRKFVPGEYLGDWAQPLRARKGDVITGLGNEYWFDPALLISGPDCTRFVATRNGDENGPGDLWVAIGNSFYDGLEP